MIKSLHSTLHGTSPSLGRVEADALVQRLRARMTVKEHFQRGALIAWCSRPANIKTRQDKWESTSVAAAAAAEGGLEWSGLRFGSSRWTHRWSPRRLYSYPSSVGETENQHTAQSPLVRTTDVHRVVTGTAHGRLTWKKTSTCWRGVSSFNMGYVHFPIMS